MHKQNFAMQPTAWPTTSEEAWRFDENLHAPGRASTAPHGQTEAFYLGSSSANADDPPIREADVNSNHSKTASGRWSGVLDLRQWRACIFSDESRFSLYHSDGRVWVQHRQVERLIDPCAQSTDGNHGPSGRGELVMMDGAMNRHRYIQILRNQTSP